MSTFKTADILRSGHTTWEHTWKNELRSLVLLGIYTMVVLVPLSWLGYISYIYDGGQVFAAMLFTVATYLVFVHFSMAIALIYRIEANEDKKPSLTISESVNKTLRESKPLWLISFFYMIVAVIPLYVVNIYAGPSLFDSPIMIVLVSLWNYLVLIIIGIPWFFSIASIVVDNKKPWDAFVTSWKTFYNKVVDIIKVSIPGLLPVYVYLYITGGLGLYIADYYDYSWPSTLLILAWGFIAVIAGIIFFAIVLPWSLNMTYPIYKTSTMEAPITTPNTKKTTPKTTTKTKKTTTKRKKASTKTKTPEED